MQSAPKAVAFNVKGFFWGYVGVTWGYTTKGYMGNIMDYIDIYMYTYTHTHTHV